MREYFYSSRRFGFSLLELIIVIAIVSILAALAIPNYSNFITRSNRADAKGALLLIANAQEQYFLSNKSYASGIEQLPVASKSPEGHYALTVESSNSTSFQVIADPDSEGASGRQAGNGKLRISSNGNREWDCNNNNSYSCSWRK